MTTPINFYRPTPYSQETKEQIWSTIVTDSHDEFCGCTEPFSHLANLLIPPDHPDRHLTINQLVRKNFRRQLCLFGGKGEEGGTTQEEEPSTENLKQEKEPDKEDFADINIEDLLAAAAAEDDTR